MSVSTSKVHSAVQAAFSDAQRNAAVHPRASKQLLNAYTVSPENFCAAFINALNRILVILSREPPVERLVQFMAKFTSAHIDTTGTFCNSILKYLTIHSNAKAAAVRFRCLQLIATILQLLPENFAFDPSLWDLLLDAVLDRAADRLPRVRVAAAGALCRLQTSGDYEEDKCTSTLVNMLATDSSPTVRKAAIHAVALTDSVLPFVLRRARDISADVRRALFETLAQKLRADALRPEERVNLLRDGLRDRSQNVRDTCRDKLLLEGWMQGSCDGNIFALVDLLECEDNETDVLRVLKVVFESPQYASLIQSCRIDVNNLTHTDVLVLRGLAEAKRGDGGIDRFIPTALEYANVLRYYAVDELASRHLLELSKSIDMSDEAGRKGLEDVIRTSFLTSREISDDTVSSAVRALRRIVGEEDGTARLLLEIIRQDILLLPEVESEDQEIQDAPAPEDQEWSDSRALSICLEALKISQQSSSSSSPVNIIFANMMKVVTPNLLMNVDEDKRRIALECLGLFCLLDKSGEEAEKYLLLFIQALKKEAGSIQELALKVIVDMLMVFDFTTGEQTQDTTRSESDVGSQTEHNGTEVSTTSSVQKLGDGSTLKGQYSPLVQEFFDLLVENLTHAEGSMRTLATQGLTRLLYVRRLAADATTLSRLIVVYHNPTTEDDHELRQCLSVFFPAFAALSGANRLVFEDGFLMTCKLFLNAPSSNKLSLVSVIRVAEFMLHLTSATGEDAASGDGVGKPADHIHERLAEGILNELMDATLNEDLASARAFARILGKLELKWSQETDLPFQIARKLAKEAIAQANDRTLVRTLKTWVNRLEATIGEETDGEEESEESTGQPELEEGSGESKDSEASVDIVDSD